MKNKKSRNFLYIMSAVILLIIIIFTYAPRTSNHMPIELSTHDFVQVDVDVEDAIYLSTECYQISMLTTSSQLRSISNALLNITKSRPNAHDLLKSIIENFDLRIAMVKITELRDGTYFANILILGKNKILNIDSRPSDAIAIALRTGAPIYVKESLLRERGIKIC